MFCSLVPRVLVMVLRRQVVPSSYWFRVCALRVAAGLGNKVFGIDTAIFGCAEALPTMHTCSDGNVLVVLPPIQWSIGLLAHSD